MALHLLNPGLRPLGLFDLEDDVDLEGGEYVGVAAQTGTSAADSANQGPFQSDGTDLEPDTGVMVSLATTAAGEFGGLADDGQDEYGTLFGSIIGANAGQATSVVGGGAVVVGPQTTLGSGKVTMWTQAGLYGISGTAAEDGDTALNVTVIGALVSATDGLWTADDAGNNAGYCLGHMTDQSLVSTTNLAAGEDQAIAHTALYFTGTNQA